jgi:hypothetical protein
MGRWVLQWQPSGRYCGRSDYFADDLSVAGTWREETVATGRPLHQIWRHPTVRLHAANATSWLPQRHGNVLFHHHLLHFPSLYLRVSPTFERRLDHQSVLTPPDFKSLDCGASIKTASIVYRDRHVEEQYQFLSCSEPSELHNPIAMFSERMQCSIVITLLNCICKH